jgi:phosphatidylserine decarboxylase
MKTLLYDESPVIGAVATCIIPVLIYKKYTHATIIACIILVFLLFFYRHYPCDITASNNQIICPADGRVMGIIEKDGNFVICIFLSPFNIHTQIYPVNGTVIDRKYDTTGQFALAMHINKSDNNEKKIHRIKMDSVEDRTVIVTQIAGFLPRRIASSDEVPMKVKAGDYLGIIKFGSRVDVSVPMKDFTLSVKSDDRVRIGDLLGQYTS